MVVAYKGAVIQSAGVNATALTFDPSSGYVGDPISVGDYMILTLIVNNHSANTPDAIAGWTVLSSGSWVVVGSLRFISFGRFRQSGDTTHTATIAGSARALQGSLVWFSGVAAGSTPQIGTGKSRATSPAETTTTTALSVTTTGPNRLALALTYERTIASLSNPEITAWTAGWTMQHYVHSGSITDAISTFAIATKQMPTAGATGDAVATYASSQATNASAFQVILEGEAPPAPVVNETITGYSRPTVASFNIKASNATTVQGDFSTAADFSSGTSRVTATSKGDGYYIAEATGLIPDTVYYWRAVLDGTPDSTLTGRTKTMPSPGDPLRVIFGSCFDSYSSGVFALMAARQPDYILQLGDLGYNAPPRVDEATLDTLAEAYATRQPVLAATNVRSLLNQFPWEYTYSDRDGAGGNSDGTYTGFTMGYVQQAYRRQIAHPTLPMSANGARAWEWGRIRFIMTDENTLATNKEATDNSSKTKLGSEQKAWFKSQIDAAKAAKQLAIWSGDTTWLFGTNTVNENPWSRYNTERAELGSYIEAATNDGMLGLIRLQGDTHALFLDDGTNNINGHFIVASAAPWHTTANVFNGTVTGGAYPTAAQVLSARQYGVCDIDDDGEVITVSIQGYSSTDSAPTEIARYNQVFTFSEEGDLPFGPGVEDIRMGSTQVNAVRLGTTILWQR